MEIEGKNVLITGGAKRIGKEITLWFAKNKANVFIHFFSSESEAGELKKQCEKLGAKAEIIKCDFSKENADFSKILEISREADIVVCNASLFYPINPEEIKYGDIKKNINVNFTFHFLIIKEMWKSMREKKKTGKVITVLDAEKSRKNFIPYHLGKYLLEYITTQIFQLFAPHVLINGIALGPILPPEGKDENYIKKLSESLPLKKQGSIEDLLSAIDFIIKNDFITGNIIYVSGGLK